MDFVRYSSVNNNGYTDRKQYLQGSIIRERNARGGRIVNMVVSFNQSNGIGLIRHSDLTRVTELYLLSNQGASL